MQLSRQLRQLSFPKFWRTGWLKPPFGRLLCRTQSAANHWAATFVHRGINSRIGDEWMCVRRHRMWAPVDQLCGRHATACPALLWQCSKSYRLCGTAVKKSGNWWQRKLLARPWCSNWSLCLGNSINRTALLCCQLQMATHCHNYSFNQLSKLRALPFASSRNHWFLWDRDRSQRCRRLPPAPRPIVCQFNELCEIWPSDSGAVTPVIGTVVL